jgi:magnesium-transporting ATPase (P-type)
MSHRPVMVSPQVEARILLITVAGRSSMDRMAKGIEHMVIETLLFIAFVVIVGAAVVKAYEWHHDVLYGPYIKAGPLKQRPR